jgi:hypothetical protein
MTYQNDFTLSSELLEQIATQGLLSIIKSYLKNLKKSYQS